ncbi:30S ribosomal protein S3 [Candidatus Pacearchaeota archaeon ex4484_26]|nr:MAG: 30S ribosomal protein S3 [Candidatus Pacearchaeota archaeon ex4484_26]
MIEKQFVGTKKKEFIIKEFVKKELGKGKVSRVGLERTPLGERIIVHTTKPGLIIGRKGLAIQELTTVLKKKFKLENPQLEIVEITKAEYDAQFMADYIASSLERFGPLRFKAIAYRALQRIIDAKALGAEIRLNGKLPSDRAKSWRFAFGYLKKTGTPAELIVNKAYANAHTRPGVIGVKVFIVPPTSDIKEIKEKKIVEEVVEK